MAKKFFYLFLILLLAFAGCKKIKEGSVQIEVIDGIPHVMNPELPLKGTVLLELEKQLEINPYEHEEIGLKSFDAVKDKDGEVILFDVNNSEAERFTKEGDYISSLFRKGQGPGEFTRMSLLYIRFMNGQIWVTGRRKLAKFDKQGQFIEEFKLGDSIATFIDQNHYITDKRTRIGFTTVETADDFPVYIEYRIKNLPEIFSTRSGKKPQNESQSGRHNS